MTFIETLVVDAQENLGLYGVALFLLGVIVGGGFVHFLGFALCSLCRSDLNVTRGS